MATDAPDAEGWLNYRTVWRWHFYAGLFCIPFVVWLSITGSIFLFKPQIERWLDRPYAHLRLDGPPAAAEAQVAAAMAAVPGSRLHLYQLPVSPDAAAQIVMGSGTQEFRVYVHPQTLAVLRVISEDKRPMNVIQHLHGELLLGDRGSLVVELAASWAIVMVLTGLYLWWPRQTQKLAGVLFIRMRQGQRILWRDLHAVTGIWISVFALFLLLTGLPWAKSWGGYLKKVRAIGGPAVVRQDWTTGRSSELAARMAMNGNGNGDGMEAMGHAGHRMPGMGIAQSYAALDRMVATVSPLGLAYPVLISPPTHAGGNWSAKSDAQNRTLRTNLTLDAGTGAILKREDFRGKSVVDRAVGIGIAAHEGQLFGLFNQLLGLATAMGLVLISVSAVVLWWRRRAVGVLGANLPVRKPRFSWGLCALVVGFGVYLPTLGVSLILVLLVERLMLRRVPVVRVWLGLSAA